jgi:serine/threonine-protein kinase
MGVVWRGRDREIGDACAIKVLRPEFAVDPAAVARFVRERTALVKFRHPNVVALRDMIVEGDRLALVMDFVDGGDLSAYRRNCGGTLAPGEAIGLAAQISDALAAAHAAGIVHRDLKPANVLLDAGQVKLADFGIARIVGESPATTTGVVVGTIGFMAPEVIRGEEPTPACDVYAAGITLYELLTGAQPFTGQAVAVMRSHLDVMPARPHGMPDRVWAVVSACLGKDPLARPSALTLAGALRDPALLREVAPDGQAAPSYGGGPCGGPQWAQDGGTPSGPVTSARLSGAFSAPAAGPVTASVRLPAMPPPAMSGTGATPPVGAVPLVGAPPASGPLSQGIPLSQGMSSPPTEVPVSWGSPETEAAFAGIGAAAGPPARRGHRARSRDDRFLGIRPVWAVAAAVVLVFAGVGGTYLTMSGGGSAKSAGPLASPLVAASQTRAAALAAKARPSASHHPATPSAKPSATVTTTPAATAGTPASATTSAGAPAGSPGGNPGPTGPNLVADGDFSDSSLSAWNKQVLNTVVVSGGQRGGYAALMTGDPTAGVTQVITGLTPGKEYELTGWIISDTDNYSTYVGVKGYDSGVGVSRALNVSSWTEAALTFTPAPGYTTAEVFCWQAVAGNGYCTDVSVRAVS